MRSWGLISTFHGINVLASGETSGSRISVLSHRTRDLVITATILGHDVTVKHDTEEEYMHSTRHARADVKKVFFDVEARNERQSCKSIS